MKRLLIRALEENAGKYWYQDVLYSGVVFAVTPLGVVSSRQVENGRIVGPYRPICALENDQSMQVDLTGQLSDYTLPQYLGKPYSGIGFGFSGDICDREVLLKDGVTYAEAQWTKDGVMLYFDVPNDKFGEVYEWYPNGSLKGIKISTNSKFYGSINFAEDGRLTYLGACRGLLKNLQTISDSARFFPFASMLGLASAKAAETFVLFGDDIDDDFFQRLLEFGALDDVSVLKLNSVNVNRLGLDGLRFLRELRFETNNALTSEVHESHIRNLATSFKKSYSRIRVFLNGKELS